MRVPMTRLGAEYASMKPEIDSAIENVLSSGRYTLESEMEQFEAEFAAFVGARHAIGVGSGSSALDIALMCLNLGEGDEVITAPNTDNPTAAAIAHAGAKVVFTDTDPRTFNLDPDEVSRAVTAKTRAILPVHLFGQPADMERICEIADGNDLTVIEDAALAVGAVHDQQRVGTFGRVGCFSLAPSKILGGVGDGGILVTNDQRVADRARVLRNYGHAPGVDLNPDNLTGGNGWEVMAHGFNSRLDAIQAAVLRVKLASLDDRIEARRDIARRYDELLEGSNVQTPYTLPGTEPAYFAYNVLVENRDLVRHSLEMNGVATRLYYNPPLHLQPAFRYLGHGEGAFPATERTSRQMLGLPIFPQMTDREVKWVAECVQRAVGPSAAKSDQGDQID